MKKSILLLSMFLTAISLMAQKDKKDLSIQDTVKITIDNVAFDEDELMSILDDEGNVIAYYDRFENKSCVVKSAKLYDLDNHLIYSIVPIIAMNGAEIHIRDTNKRRGLIAPPKNIKIGFNMKYDMDVNYFEEPFDFVYEAKLGFGKVSVSEKVTYDKKTIMEYIITSTLSGIDVTPIYVDGDFFESNKLEAASWALMMLLYGELSMEINKMNRVNNTEIHHHDI